MDFRLPVLLALLLAPAVVKTLDEDPGDAPDALESQDWDTDVQYDDESRDDEEDATPTPSDDDEGEGSE